jgi:uncharacterized protein YjeT (DUF2065 family)
MNRSGIYITVAGIAVVIFGILLFQNLHHINAVDSQSETIYINGLLSFKWHYFIGLVLIVTGLITLITPKHEAGHRYS